MMLKNNAIMSCCLTPLMLFVAACYRLLQPAACYRLLQPTACDRQLQTPSLLLS